MDILKHNARSVRSMRIQYRIIQIIIYLYTHAHTDTENNGSRMDVCGFGIRSFITSYTQTTPGL